MDVWKILQIEPTEDKKAIRRAYAKRSRECHPEDAPEEFQVLYEAYQKALALADLAGKRNAEGRNRRPDAGQDGKERVRASFDINEDPGHEEGGRFGSHEAEEEILKLFRRQKQEQEKKRDEFLEAWKTFVHRQESHADDSDWEEFVANSGFSEILYDLWVVDAILEEIRYCLNFRMESCMKLWELYGFEAYGFMETAEDGGVFGPELMRLYRFLLPARKLYQAREDARRLKEQEERQKWERKLRWEKKKRIAVCILSGLAVVCLLFMLIAAPVIDTARMRNAAEEYLSLHYPQIAFEIGGEEASEKQGMYTLSFCTAEMPDLEARLYLKRTGWPGFFRVVSDDFPEALGRRIEECCGLSPTGGKNGKEGAVFQLIFSFADMDGIALFCESFSGLTGNEELSALLSGIPVFFRADDVLFPDFFMYGGEGGFPAGQSYEMGGMPGTDELCSALTMDYVEYLYNYEAWRLTDGLREAYEGEYIARLEEFLKEMPDGKGVGEFRPPVVVYQKNGKEYITVGNVYLYCTALGLDTTVHADGRGFHVYGRDCLYFFGGPSDSSGGVYKAAKINIETETAFELDRLSDLFLQEETGDGSDRN